MEITQLRRKTQWKISQLSDVSVFENPAPETDYLRSELLGIRKGKKTSGAQSIWSLTDRFRGNKWDKQMKQLHV